MSEDVTELICRFAGVDSLTVIKRLVKETCEDELNLRNNWCQNKTTQNIVKLLVNLVKHFTDTLTTEEFMQEIANITWRLCLPILESLHPSSSETEETRQLLYGTCELLLECLRRSSTPLTLEVLGVLLKGLDISKHAHEGGIVFSLDSYPPGYIDLLCVVEFIRAYLHGIEQTLDSEIKKAFDDCFLKLLLTISHVPERVTTRVMSSGLFYLLKEEHEKVDQRLQIVWKHIQSLCKGQKQNNFEQEALLVFCSLAEFFFPMSAPIPSTDLQCCDDFWEVVQIGLCAENPLARKRSLYLLKRVVDTCERREVDVNVAREDVPIFQWKADAKNYEAKVWQDYILLVETLEEKQVHVIKPLLWRMQALIKAASSTVDDVAAGDCVVGWRLHTSWLLTALLRCFNHESHQVVRWAVDTVLAFDFTQLPLRQQGQLQFLCGKFLFILQELKLYVRPPGVEYGLCPPVGSQLVTFFSSCVQALPTAQEQSGWVCAVLQTLLSATWGSIPLYFLSRAMAALPPAPILDASALGLVKEVLVRLMTTLEPLPKGAIQCYLLQTVLHLADKTAVTVEDLAGLLAVLERRECFRRGTLLWDEVVCWLKQTSLQDPNWAASSIRASLHTMVSQFLAEDLDSGISSSMYLTKVGRLLVLAADADLLPGLQGSSQGEGSLTEVISVINSINSHPYMSRIKADRAVALLSVVASEHLSLSQEADRRDMVQDAVEQCWEQLFLYTDNRVIQDSQQISNLDLVDMFCACLKTFCKGYLQPSQYLDPLNNIAVSCSKTVLSGRPLYHLSEGHLTQLASVIRLLQACSEERREGLRVVPEECVEDQMVIVSCCCLLATIADLAASLSPDTELHQTLLQFTVNFQLTSTFRKLPARHSLRDKSISQKDWGRVVSQYIHAQWTCVKFQLETFPDQVEVPQLVAACYEALDVGTRDSDVAVLGCITSLLVQVEKVREGEVCDLLHVTWTKAQEELHCASYWRKLELFIILISQTPLLLSPPGSPLNICLLKHMEQLVKLGGEKMGVVNLLFEHLLHPLTTPHTGVCVATHLLPIIADGAVFGAIHKRTDRLVLELNAHIRTRKRNCAANEVLGSCNKTDGTVRAMVVSFLSQLQPGVSEHRELVQLLLKELYSRYQALTEAADFRQYNNSLCHRQKNRIFQTITVLEPFVGPGQGQDQLWDFVWACLVSEAHPSVRHMQEWILMRQIHRFPRLLLTRIWQHFSQFIDKRNLSLCSLMHVLARVGPHLPQDMQEEFYDQSLSRLLPWCLAHHFNTRVHAQVSLGLLWRQCQLLGLHDLLARNNILQRILDFQTDNNNSTKNLQKLMSNYFYQSFDFLADFSIETIFLTLPRLAMLTDEEWLQPWVFEQVDKTWTEVDSDRLLPLFNPSTTLKECVPGPWKVKPQGESWGAEEEVLDGDVQKKIMPWRLMTPQEDLDHHLRETSRKIHKQGGLILVTSLIDKIPNLGGLCRTSEIFGVSEFIIGNLCFIEDKAFQHLSVTAQNWIPITEYHLSEGHLTQLTSVIRLLQACSEERREGLRVVPEVPPHRLKEFLQDRRKDGYTLVGVEQTANSISLTNYKFPTRTLLILGSSDGCGKQQTNYLTTTLECVGFSVNREKSVLLPLKEVYLPEKKVFKIIHAAKKLLSNRNEKEGLPVELIQLLDVCVEIPQQGLIRSLNVHVSGALLVWEYARQQMNLNSQ